VSRNPAEPRSLPVGVFDSGIGGLTVVKELQRLLPNEDIIYLGDTARVPYGGKSAETVCRYSIELADILVHEQAKVLIVACNTASSVAIPALRQHVTVPVIGVIEPGARAAVEVTRTRRVGVIGTRATIRSGSYEKALQMLDPSIAVTSRACPLLVPLIEEGLLEDEVTDMVISRYLGPMISDGVDTVVLGCTHYPLLVPAISRQLHDSIQLVDSAINCARAAHVLLEEKGLRNRADRRGQLRVALTDTADNFLNVAREALQLEIGEIELRALA
jgi:glutamate racemase